MEQAILETLNLARAARRAAVTVSDLTGGVRVYLEGDDCPEPWREAVARALQSGRAGIVPCGGEQKRIPQRRLVLAAAHQPNRDGGTFEGLARTPAAGPDGRGADKIVQ